MAESMTEVSAQLTAAPPLTRKRIDALFREWGAMLDEARRTQVLVCVSDTYSGPPLRIHDPEHGTLILCSPDQAEECHRRVPMHLVRVVSEKTALFEVTGPLHAVVEPFSRPPYVVR